MDEYTKNRMTEEKNIRNPELMREMQRNNDRALSNIEAIPGGFNHLRRMYNTFQSPLESAMSPGGTSSSDEANARLARELNVESVPENSLNTNALPNPWAAPASNNTSSTPAAATPAANPFAAFGGGGNNNNGAGNPFAGKVKKKRWTCGLLFIFINSLTWRWRCWITVRSTTTTTITATTQSIAYTTTRINSFLGRSSFYSS